MSVFRLLIVASSVLIPSLAVAQQAPPPSNQWVGSVAAGANFGQEADGASVTFGGGLGYLWRSILGAEVLADFTPNFALDPSRTTALFGQRPWFSSYMINVIGAAPLGARGPYQPYLSAGLGALTFRADRPQSAGAIDNPPDGNRMGANVGGGLMTFRGNLGFRADLRYFRGFEAHPVGGPADTVFAQLAFRQFSFWRANAGLAFRW